MAPLPPFKRPEVSAAAARDEKVMGMKDALFATAAAVSGMPPDGRLIVSPGR
jgi:predicted nuclease of predicted toxin-antitoxin system